MGNMTIKRTPHLKQLDWIKDRSSEPGYFSWRRLEARKVMVEEGRWEEVRIMDDKIWTNRRKNQSRHLRLVQPFIIANVSPKRGVVTAWYLLIRSASDDQTLSWDTREWLRLLSTVFLRRGNPNVQFGT
jgi:hypothetical protein